MNNSVAIWVGRFDSDQELQDYLDIDYTAEQDNSEYMASEFAEASKYSTTTKTSGKPTAPRPNR